MEGEGENEIGVNADDGQVLVKINPEFYRPAEVELLVGDPDKAFNKLGWKATTSLEDLCSMMIEADLVRVNSATSF